MGTVRFGFHTIHFSPMFGGAGPIIDVIEAAAAAGFDAIGVDLPSVDAHLAGGGSVADIGHAIADGGLACSDVLVLVPGADPDLAGTARTLGALASALGAPACIAAVGAPRPWPALVAELRECAAILENHGCRLAVEFTPYSPLATLADASALCAEIGWERTGLVIDSLHFFRSGAPWAALAAVEAEHLLVIQWNDAPAEAAASLVDESRHGRLLPGTGGLPLAELAVALRDVAGDDGVVLVSAEILSEPMRRSPVTAAVARVHAALTDPAAGWVATGAAG